LREIEKKNKQINNMNLRLIFILFAVLIFLVKGGCSDLEGNKFHLILNRIIHNFKNFQNTNQFIKCLYHLSLSRFVQIAMKELHIVGGETNA
jgi:hypothetical protein